MRHEFKRSSRFNRSGLRADRSPPHPSHLLQPLESRIQFSAAPLTSLAHAVRDAAHTAAHDLIVAASKKSSSLHSANVVLSPSAGATAISGLTAIPVSSYSAISNCQLETIAGQSSPNIGYVSPAGAYVEYTITAPAAGSYNLTLGLASVWGGTLRADVNGVSNGQVNAPATGSWTSYSPATLSVQLSAGTNVLRLSSLFSTQYNINAISLAPNSTGTSSPVIPVSDQTSINIPSYSAIYNSALEYRNGPDIGYVSPMGAYVEYTINVATAGNYTLSVGAGGMNAATFDVLDNGSKLTTFNTSSSGSWSTYGTYTQTVYLNSGTQTLRLASKFGTQYNLFSIALSRQGTTSTPPSMPPTGGGVTINQRWMTSFTELDITGTSGNDNITVTQSGNTLTISANGMTQQVSGTFGDIAIWGGSGNDKITVDSSVSIDARVYGGAGTNVISDSTRGIATIVSINGAADTLTGNFSNTSFWVDATDIVNASTFEWNNNHVHVVSGFYEPYTSIPGAAGYVSSTLDGSNLTDPAGAGVGTTRLSASSFWGTGPGQNDINQGSVGDCYYLTALQSLARLQTDRLRQLAVDLGDGTYAVQYKRNGVTQYVRVDGDLPSWSSDGSGGGGSLVYNRPGGSGNQWASIMEKAYAYFRSGANSYSSLDIGWMTAVYNDFGIAASTLALPQDQNSFFSTAAAALATNKPLDIGTVTSLAPGAPLVSKHTYSVLAVSRDASGNVLVTLRNPWGTDGFNVDSNPWDGQLTILYSVLRASASSGSIVA